MMKREPVRIGLSNSKLGPQEALWLKGAMICTGCQYHGADLEGKHSCGWPGYKRPRGMGKSVAVPDWCMVLKLRGQGEDPEQVAWALEQSGLEDLEP